MFAIIMVVVAIVVSVVRVVASGHHVVFDLDDTVMKGVMGHELSFPEEFEGATADDWAAWESLAVLCVPIRRYAMMWKLYRMIGVEVVVMTARSVRSRGVTIDVLKAHGMVADVYLFRAEAHEDDSSAFVKGVMVDLVEGVGGTRALAAYEDSKSNAAMFAERGYRSVLVEVA